MSSVNRFTVDAIGGPGAEIVGDRGGWAGEVPADLPVSSAETLYV
ncbi:MAG TPA: hypothetical protein VN880_00700 [Solirubrobacteraceae bacterium]|nr:hypothetical protein [Solirubrobacteraceae bacterium]